MTFEAYLEARRKEVDAALATWLPGPPKVPAVLADAMHYSLFAGGKRLRPMLVIASAEGVAQVVGSSEAAARDAALPAACAIEMIHTYSLIHDDLPAMDDDELRRGRPTSHVVHGEGTAILAGDGLHAEAFALLAREPQGFHPTLMARKLRVSALIAEAAGPVGMVGGQAIDLAAVKPGPASAKATAGTPPEPFSADGLQAMHMRKTGALIRAAVGAGAIMGGGDDRLVATLDTYATEIGLAFQIVDDILDEEGSAGSLGKTAGKDRAAGKPTYTSFYGLDRSRELAAACYSNANRALERSGLLESRLADIAGWVVNRTRLDRPGHFSIQPCSGHGPVALDRTRGELHHLCRFLDRQPAKIPEFDNATLLRVQRLEPRQRLVKDERVSGINGGRRRRGIGVVDRDLCDASTALEPSVVAGVVHDDAPHQLCGDAEEVRAILPVNRPLPNELEIGLVHERRGLQRVIAPLAREVPRRQGV